MLTCQIVTVTERTLKREHGCVIITDEIHDSGRRRRTCVERSGSNEAGMKRNGIETADTDTYGYRTNKTSNSKTVIYKNISSKLNETIELLHAIIRLIGISGHCSVS